MLAPGGGRGTSASIAAGSKQVQLIAGPASIQVPIRWLEFVQFVFREVVLDLNASLNLLPENVLLVE